MLTIAFFAGLLLQLLGAALLFTRHDLTAWGFVGGGLFVSLITLTILAIG